MANLMPASSHSALLRPLQKKWYSSTVCKLTLEVKRVSPKRVMHRAAAAMTKIPTLPLSSGSHIPVLGLGTGSLGHKGKLPANGNREKDVGRFLQKSLDDLGLPYVDLYLIHYPCGILGTADDTLIPHKIIFDPTTDILGIWRGMEAQVKSSSTSVSTSLPSGGAMEAQVAAGKANNIGLSNFNAEQLQRVIKGCQVRPSVLQVEVHVYMQQGALRALCAQHDILVCGFCPLGGPFRLSSKTSKLEKMKPLLDDPLVLDVAAAHHKTPAQVLLRYLHQINVIPIPKSANPTRLLQNTQIFDFELTSAEMSSLAGLDQGPEGRIITEFFHGDHAHPEFPFHPPN
ncbi:1,5-anhydro-D-fructose reductase-like isoform X4 [Procambarus clarkii]|uniref:1,5-anhydro-D-fructose reductase-like isoform X4 n=1 Tax=Procambarus clarkii TaxID=6728 RepID=UPI003743FAF3